ncbi:MAG: carbonic anhydrase family protein [Reichenbachiella sp.]
MKHFTFLILILQSTVAFGQFDQSLYDKNHEHHSWAYSGQYGPDHWSEIDPDYASCDGKTQSPIDIITKKCQETPIDLDFHYHPFFVDVINNGHTLIEKVVEPKALELNGKSYTLLQFHFHTPSEHHVNGIESPMEIHFVHENAAGHYVVVAVMVEYGKERNPFLSHFMKSLPTHVDEEIRSYEQADPMETFPKDFHNFYTYSGSLTTPPCTEGVTWVVLGQHVVATFDQVEAIHQIIHDDNRPIQAANKRVVYHHSSSGK